jgi:hypothetical protein
VNNGSFGHVSLLPLGRQHGTESVEPAFPQRTTLRNPLLGDLQAGGLDVTGAYPADLGRSNQTAFFEQLEVLHNRCERNVQGLSKLRRGLRRATELLHDCPSSRIA